MRSSRRAQPGLDAWPGYVDALSTLLMVIIFVLLVFVLAQAFLSVALNSSNQALGKLNRQVAELTDMLSVERGTAATLQRTVTGLADQLNTADMERAAIVAKSRSLAEQLADAGVAAKASATREAALRDELSAATRSASAQATTLTADAAQIAALQKTVAADRDTVQARLADLAKLELEVKALTALRDQLTTELGTSKTAQADAEKLSQSASAQVALLTQQVERLRDELGQLAAALQIARTASAQKDVQIGDLGRKLNAALLSRVQELQRYRSDFFGKLSAVLKNKPGIRVVGDRFVFQSDVLFPVGGTDIGDAGKAQIADIAKTLKQIIPTIPPGLHWILSVGGYTDKTPIDTPKFANNWELSAQRAIDVVQLLIADGIPPEHLAAAAYSSYQPLDTADTPAAFTKNRRIELRITN